MTENLIAVALARSYVHAYACVKQLKVFTMYCLHVQAGGFTGGGGRPLGKGSSGGEGRDRVFLFLGAGLAQQINEVSKNNMLPIMIARIWIASDRNDQQHLST